MKNFILGLTGAMLMATVSLTARAQNVKYVLDKKITLPGNGGYDYLSIDKANNRLYVSHGTEVNVVDLATEKLIGTIDGMQGVHGIAIDNKVNKGFISDGRGNAAVVFDLKSLKKVASIPLSNKGADAILYDSFSDRVLTFNGDSNNASVINPNTLTQTETIQLSGAPEFAVSDGKGKIYNNLEDKSSLDVIDTKTMKVIKNYPLAPCGGPTGLALDEKNQRLFTVCRENKGMSVIDITTGKVIATIPIGAGVDAVAYDADTKLLLASNGDGTTTVIQQQSANIYQPVQTIITQYRAKTLALDTKTHKIYLSVATFEKGTRKVMPNTFTVLVYKLQ